MSLNVTEESAIMSKDRSETRPEGVSEKYKHHTTKLYKWISLQTL